MRAYRVDDPLCTRSGLQVAVYIPGGAWLAAFTF